MEQPTESKYKSAFSRERPEHARGDAFSLRHPKMPLGQRAKIFSPFAALKGFEEAIDSKLVRYVAKKELSEEELAQLNRTLGELAECLRARRPVAVAVRFYVPCADENHEAYGLYGQYRSVTGTLRRIDPVLRKSIQVDETEIEFADIAELRLAPPAADPSGQEGEI